MAAFTQSAENAQSANLQSAQGLDYNHDYEDDDDLEYEPPQSAQIRRGESSPLSRSDDESVPNTASPVELEEQQSRELSDPPDLHRPNKYHGPPSTWRDWTAAERDVARSLDMLKARDLSVHTFNSYALKKRCERLAEQKRKDSSKEEPWKPFNDWSAWPMPVEDVPRLDENPLDDTAYLKDQRIFQNRSREELRELLLAHVTKVARERFNDRECEGCDGLHSYSGPNQEQQTARQDPDIGSAISDGVTDNESRASMKRSYSDASMASSRSRKRRRSINQGPDLEPVPMADDDRAMRIARPSIEHIISSLERLLHSLHVARQHYFNQPNPHQRKRKRKPKKPPKKGTKNKAAPSDDRRESDTDAAEAEKSSDEEEVDDSDPEPTPMDPAELQAAKHASRLRTLQRYGLRDWKDVLGLAAMLGWDENALRRTRDRCSILFGESMHLGHLDLDMNGRAVAHHDESPESCGSEDEIEGGVHVDGFLRPIKRRRGWRGKNTQKGNWKSRAKDLQTGTKEETEHESEASPEASSAQNQHYIASDDNDETGHIPEQPEVIPDSSD